MLALEIEREMRPSIVVHQSCMRRRRVGQCLRGQRATHSVRQGTPDMRASGIPPGGSAAGRQTVYTPLHIILRYHSDYIAHPHLACVPSNYLDPPTPNTPRFDAISNYKPANYLPRRQLSFQMLQRFKKRKPLMYYVGHTHTPM